MKKQICQNREFYHAYYKQYSSIYMKTDSGFCEKYGKNLIQAKSCADYNEAKRD